MAFLEWLLIVTFAVSTLGMALAWLAYRRAGLAAAAPAGLAEKLALVQAAVDRHPDTLRAENSALREEHSRQAQQLREEVIRLVTGFQSALGDRFDKLGEGQTAAAATLRQELTDAQKRQGEVVDASTKRLGDSQKERLDVMGAQLKELREAATADQLKARQLLGEQLEKVRTDGEARQKEIRETLSSELTKLRGENELKLEQMRLTVDEKLQGTLEQRLGESFKLVSERLDTVHKGLGEMQNLATGVGDLKRVLINVRSRGAWGEVQLGALLEDILAPGQFEEQVVVKKGSQERVDFAIILPHGEDDDKLYLPIDCKYPHEDYERLVFAQEAGDPEGVQNAGQSLEKAIREKAKSISQKYVSPPSTTPFAVMYLPSESLYAEVARRQVLMDELRRNYDVAVLGPSNLGSYLHSLRFGFQTLRVQKRSSEVQKVLSDVKTEFGKYAGIWDKVATQLQTAANTVDLARSKTTTLHQKLRGVEALSSNVEAAPLLIAASAIDPNEPPIADEAA